MTKNRVRDLFWDLSNKIIGNDNIAINKSCIPACPPSRSAYKKIAKLAEERSTTFAKRCNLYRFKRITDNNMQSNGKTKKA